jgi:ApbE superfamily uncharacterized protein (UPF0280 family)
MKEDKERTYRIDIRSRGLLSFNVAVKETDLWISAERPLEKEARDLVFDSRHQLESYIQSHPEFLTALRPYPPNGLAPPLVGEMIQATEDFGVGPMACVAGAIAQCVGRGLLQWSRQVIVENGGDIFLKADRKIIVSVLAGDSTFSGKIGLMIPVRQMPLGICSSSGTVGHSLSLGVADAVCVLSPSALVADGAATAIGNMIKGKKDLDKAAAWAKKTKGLLGGLIILGDRMAAWGDIDLVRL